MKLLAILILQSIMLHLTKEDLVKIQCPKKRNIEKQLVQIIVYDINSDKTLKITNSTAEIEIEDIKSFKYVCIYTYYVSTKDNFKSLETGNSFL